MNYYSAPGIINDVVPHKELGEHFIKIVSNFFEVSPLDVKSASRKKELVLVRFIAIHLMCYNLDLSLKEIGRLFSSRDHSSVIHARDKMNDILESKFSVDRDTQDFYKYCERECMKIKKLNISL